MSKNVVRTVIAEWRVMPHNYPPRGDPPARGRLVIREDARPHVYDAEVALEYRPSTAKNGEDLPSWQTVGTLGIADKSDFAYTGAVSRGGI